MRRARRIRQTQSVRVHSTSRYLRKVEKYSLRVLSTTTLEAERTRGQGWDPGRASYATSRPSRATQRSRRACVACPLAMGRRARCGCPLRISRLGSRRSDPKLVSGSLALSIYEIAISVIDRAPHGTSWTTVDGSQKRSGSRVASSKYCRQRCILPKAHGLRVRGQVSRRRRLGASFALHSPLRQADP